MARALIKPNAENASLSELDTACGCAASSRESSRMRAIKALILGGAHGFVAKVFGVDERTLRRWVTRFNTRGIDGLKDEKRPGRPRAIAPDKAQKCLEVLEHPEQAQRTFWTGVRLHGYLREQLKVEASYSTLMRLVHEAGYRLKVPQPWPDRQDEEQREVFREKLRALAEDEEIELWFGDEMGLDGDPRPRRRWAMRGKKLRSIKNGDHMRLNVTGIVCPRRGEFYAIEFSHSDRETFQAFLDAANRDLQLERKRQILILDNASWHKVRSLSWGRFEPVYLPPYSPDFNPIERMWLIIKNEWFNNWVAKTRDQLIERADQALLWAIDRQELNKTTCSIRAIL